MSAIKYRPEVDGLRALAIIPVLIFHLNPQWLCGGFMGVDVFFVISGYLITSIILAELAAGSFTFIGFWERRVRRIFPALGFMLLAVLLFALAAFYPPAQLALLGRQAVKVLSCVSNHYMLLITADYWGQSASMVPLLHTWSLAVEEQFYFFLPPLIFVIFRWWDKRWILPTLGILAAASFTYCVSQTEVNQSSAFYLLTSRAWELLAGSILAIVAPRIVVPGQASAVRWLADLGLAIVVGGYVFLSEVDFPGWKAVAPVAGTVMFIGFSPCGGYAARLLRARPMIFIGKASYSIYLWHWPALVFGKLFADIFEVPSLRWWALLVSVGIAIGSYLWVEKLGKQIRLIWRYAGAFAVVIIAVALLAAFNRRDLTPVEINQTESRSGMYEAVYANRNALRVNKIQNLGTHFYLPDDQMPVNRWGFEPRIINPERPQDIIVLGDSHGLMWGSVIERIALRGKVGCQLWTVSGASPFLDTSPLPRANLDSAQRTEFNKQKMQSIKLNQPKVVVISTRLDSKWHGSAAPQDLESINDLIIAVHGASPASHIVIIGQPPMAAFGNQNAVQWLGWREKFWHATSVPSTHTESWQAANLYVQELPRKFNYVQVVKVSDFYELPGNRIQIIKDGRVTYTDDNHLSEYGASLAEARIQGAIEPLLR